MSSLITVGPITQRLIATGAEKHVWGKTAWCACGAATLRLVLKCSPKNCNEKATDGARGAHARGRIQHKHNSFAGDVFLSTCLGEISRIVPHALGVKRLTQN